jgi:hypothetical protein
MTSLMHAPLTTKQRQQQQQQVVTTAAAFAVSASVHISYEDKGQQESIDSLGVLTESSIVID